MKCDKCDNEATVHEVMIAGGKRKEKHLCERCAREEGVGVVATPPSIDKLLQGVIQLQPSSDAPTGTESSVASPAGAQAASSATVCPDCGTTFAQFRATGLLGCPACYDVFESQLVPLLARAHEGGTHHVGRVPGSQRTSAGAAPSQEPSDAGVRERLVLLRKSLEEAVAGEQYEKAAKIRDEMHRLQSRPLAPGGAKPAPAPAPQPTRARRRNPATEEPE